MEVPPLPTPAPAPVPIPAPMPAPMPTPPSSPPSSGGIGWFSISLIVIAIVLLIAIVIIGRNLGIFREAPQEEQKKETFVVGNSGPDPSCNTKDTYAIFPSL